MPGCGDDRPTADPAAGRRARVGAGPRAEADPGVRTGACSRGGPSRMAHPVVRGSAATPGAMAHWRVRDAARRWRGLLAPAPPGAAPLLPGPALAAAGAPPAAAAPRR